MARLRRWLRQFRLPRAFHRRRTPPDPRLLDRRALKDIGLGRSDLPAICAGLMDADATRRPRGSRSGHGSPATRRGASS